MNDNEREQWVNNDEGLYRWFLSWKRTNRGGMRGFLRANRAEIDNAINRALGRGPECKR